MINKFIQYLHRRSFLCRLFLYCFSVLSLLLIFLLTNYFITSKELKQQLYEKIDENLSFISETIDGKVETVQKMALSFFNSDTVLEYYCPDEELEPPILAEQWRVCRVLLQNESLFNDFVKRYYAYYTKSQKVYTGAGVYTKESYFNEFYQYDLYSEEDLNVGLKNNRFRILMPTLLYSKDDGNSEEVLPIEYAQNIKGNQVVFIADLCCEEMRNILDCATILSGINVLVFRENDMLVQSTDTIYSEEGMARINQSITAGIAEQSVTIDGAEYYLFQKKSQYASLGYVALVPKAEINNMLYSNLYYIFTLGIILLSTGLLLSVFFSYRIYKPINSVISSISNEIGRKTEDEVTYLQQSFSNMVAEKKKYNIRLNYYGERYIEHQMQLIINGIGILNSEELLKNLREIYGFRYECYLCANVLFNFTEHFYESFSDKDQDVITKKLGEIIQSILDEKEHCYVFQNQNGLFTCIINYDGEKEITEIKNSIEDLESIFKADSCYYHVHIGMDGEVSTLEKLNCAYSHSMVALRNCNSEQVFELKDYRELPRKNKVTFTFYDQKKIVNCIMIGNKEKLVQLLNQIINENHKSYIEFHDIKELFMQLYYVGQRCLEENQIESAEDNAYSMLEKVKNIKNEEEAYACRKDIAEFLLKVLELVNSQEQKEDSGIVCKMKQYIEANYTLNLNLDSIADEFNLTAKYISKIFKQKAGENITDYIDKVRIEQSKHLLADTNMRIGDIAVAVGIESRTTFFRVFRKLEGISPNEYRTITTSQERKKLI